MDIAENESNDKRENTFMTIRRRRRREIEQFRLARDIDAAVRDLPKFVDRRMKHIARDLRQLDRRLYQQVVSYIDLRLRAGLEVPIPPLRGHAISPDTAIFMDDLLKILRPSEILELGSGFSSALLARHCMKYGGKLTSVDHVQQFGSLAAGYVSAWGAQSCFELIIADVIEQPLENGEHVLFYDLGPVAEKGVKFDFVFLDGPPKYVAEKVRGGFLPLFKDVLSPGCTILVDDYYRPGEMEMVAAWVADGLVEIVEENTAVEKHAAVLKFVG